MYYYKSNKLNYSLGGISRSSTIIIAYLMKKYKISLKDSHNYVINLKQDIKPNNGFMNKLINFEKSLLYTRISENNYKCG